MGKKLYEETQEGGICFKSERKPWEVRVPNYVYDLWMPVLGVVDIGVYNVYCRLERENVVKAISLGTIARACRIGKSRLYDTNKRLEKCGFIRIAPPEGWQRLAHYTTEITVLDPPQEVPAWAIKEYCQLKHGYQPLSPWLVQEDETQIEPAGVPNGTSGETGQDAVKEPEGTPKVVTLGLQPLGVELVDVEANFFIKNPNVPASPDSGGADSGKEVDDEQEIDTGHPAGHSDGGSDVRPDGQFPADACGGAGGVDIGDNRRNHIAADPLMMSFERRTAAARAGPGGNFADASEDALVAKAITCLCRGKPPKQGSGTWRDMTNILKPIHADWGLHDMEVDEALAVVEAAIALFLDEKSEMAVYKYPSFDANYGQYLSRAMNGDRKGDRHDNAHQRDRGRIAQGAVRREVATEEEARAILG